MRETATIGIVGGGQLGRMLTLAAQPLGYKVVVLDSNEGCPAGQVGAEVIVGDLYDEVAIQQLADRSDVVTVEIEHLNTDALQRIADAGKPVHPAPATIKLIQNKYAQKQLLEKHKVAVAPFVDTPTKAAAKKALESFGGSMILKTKFGAYDGRGNAIVRSSDELETAWVQLGVKNLYAEALIDFTKELSVIIARSRTGSIQIYDVVEMYHERSICFEVIAPAQISETARTNAIKLAKKVSPLLEGAGVFAIEMFLDSNNQVLVNEIAPRVHNSGHHTIESAATSQFEQHIRAVAGMSLGDTTLVTPTAVMINILGTRNETSEVDVNSLLPEADINVHWYGKSPIKVDRKMGHITILGNSVKDVRERAKKARGKLPI